MSDIGRGGKGRKFQVERRTSVESCKAVGSLVNSRNWKKVSVAGLTSGAGDSNSWFGRSGGS